MTQSSTGEESPVVVLIQLIAVTVFGVILYNLPPPFKIIGIVFLSVPVIGVIFLVWACLDSWVSTSSGQEYSDPETDKFVALEAARDKVALIVNEHIERLAHRRNTLIHIDHYGVIDSSGWNKEVQYFVDNVVRPKLSDAEAAAVLDYGMSAFFQEEIDHVVLMWSTNTTNAPSETGFNNEISPTEFEELCASVLRSEGWDASTTKGSGDQGADVIASKNGTKLVIQCKLYSGSVGNKAVQEAIAAKAYYQANLAAVVTNSYFTPGAKELANAAGVILMDNFDLKKFAHEHS